MKIAVCSPAREMVHTAFTCDLTALVSHWIYKNGPKGGQINFYTSMGTLIADQRQNLAIEALSEMADWILWLDNDMRFPPDALDRLLARNQAIVGCNYPTRKVPPRFTAQNFDGEKWVTVSTDDDKKGIEQVDTLGFGCILTKSEVFKKIPQPWFHLVYSTVNNQFFGEDSFFCMQAAKAGYKTFLDHDLSKEIKHIGSLEFCWEHVKIINEEGA